MLPEPWMQTDAGSELAAALLTELSKEVGPGHQLHGLTMGAFANCGACDDAIFQLEDGTWALVHLTWAGREEAEPFPWTSKVDTEADLEQLVADRTH
jgi:hypothetical protein